MLRCKYSKRHRTIASNALIKLCVIRPIGIMHLSALHSNRPVREEEAEATQHTTTTQHIYIAFVVCLQQVVASPGVVVSPVPPTSNVNNIERLLCLYMYQPSYIPSIPSFFSSSLLDSPFDSVVFCFCFQVELCSTAVSGLRTNVELSSTAFNNIIYRLLVGAYVPCFMILEPWH